MTEQRTDDWYQARLGLVTGSRAYDVVKGPKYAYWKNYKAELLIERLTGVPTENFTSKPMQWGIDNEPVARLMYQLETKHQVEKYGFVKDPQRDFGASPDGGIKGINGGVEFKCPNTATHIDTLKTGKVPPQFYAQMQAQMHVMGWEFVDYVSFDPRLPDRAQLFIKRVERDQAYIDDMLAAVDTFLAELAQDISFVQNYEKTDGTTVKVERKVKE